MTGRNVPAWTWLVAAMVLAAALYVPALHGPFVLDDAEALYPQAALQAQGAPWHDVLRQAPPHVRARALSNASFYAGNAMAGPAMPPDPFVYKLGNLLIHLACGWAAFLLARRIGLATGIPPDRAARMAVLAAALFLLHPLLVSTVLYSVQRMSQLSTLFLMLSVHAYLRWRQSLAELSRAASLVRVALCAALALLALASKENGVLAPLLFAAVEMSLFRLPPKATPERDRFDTGFALLIAAPLMAGVVALVLHWPSLLHGYGRRDFTLVERVLTELHVLAGYLGQIGWPRIGSMGLYHDDLAVRTSITFSTWLLIVAFASAITAAIAFRRRSPLFALSVLWFFAAHALESTVIALELVFEHRNYLAIFGPLLATAWLATRPGRWPMAAVLTAGILLALSIQLARRVQDWRDYPRWIAAEAARHPRSVRAGTEFVMYLARTGQATSAAAERERLSASVPDRAQPVLLNLLDACLGDENPRILGEQDIARLSTARLGKDALHAFVAARAQLTRRCPEPDWRQFALAAEAMAANPRSRTDTEFRAGAWRLAAGAHLQRSDWSAVRTALRQAIAAQDNDPRDWLLLAEAEARLSHRAGYLEARRRLLALLGGRPGPLAGELERVDRLARGLR